MLLVRSGAYYHVEVVDGPLVNRHKPSVDVLFRSVARYAGANAMGVIMTGMGRDGVDGIAAIKAAGGRTLAQDEKTSAIYGMNKIAVDQGMIERVVALDQMADELAHLVNGG